MMVYDNLTVELLWEFAYSARHEQNLLVDLSTLNIIGTRAQRRLTHDPSETEDTLGARGEVYMVARGEEFTEPCDSQEVPLVDMNGFILQCYSGCSTSH